jgi:hypothetical protein
MNELHELIGHYRLLHKKYGFESLSMQEITNRLLKINIPTHATG